MEGAEKAELRLGLVLYGGVALAVYIYGVVVEVQRLMRDDSSAYAEAMEQAGIGRAVVDVISGTSAGGINGILLAKAISSGADVSQIEDLWVEGGDVDVLLNRIDDPAPASLLATDAFEERLRGGFGRLDQQSWDPAGDEVLDLFVSTTHLRGDRRGFYDALGREITTRAHRFVIQLKLRRRYGHDDFQPGSDAGSGNDRLVKLARATSAFPVAFEPVLIKEDDHLLGPQAEPEGWFADGGILNNKPFTEALRTIFTRSAENGPVRRWLLSVDPDPKPVPKGKGPGDEPAFDQVAVAAVTRIPRYQSLVSDLEGLEEHNESVRRVNRTVIEMEAGIADAGSARGDGATPAYREMRRRAWSQLVADQMVEVVRPEAPAEFDPDAVAAAIREGALGVIVERETELARGEDGGFDEDRATRSDLAFQRRRIYYLIKLLGMAVGQEAELAAVRASLWTAFEEISQALWELLAKDPLDLAPTSAGPEPEGEERHLAYTAAAARLRGAWPALSNAGPDVVGRFAGSLDGVSIMLPLDQTDENGRSSTTVVSLLDVFAGFAARDFFLLSIETGGGIEFRDLVNHAQISPQSAQVTGVPAEKKLAGDTAGHFGGFLDPGWRQNDILWGRLDAAEILVRAILVDSTAEKQDVVIEAVCREILADALPEALKTKDGDWKKYLADNAMGEKTLADIDRDRQRGLAYRAAAVVRGMLHRAAEKANEPGADQGFRAEALGAADGIVRKALAIPWRVAGLFLRRFARDTEKDD